MSHRSPQARAARKAAARARNRERAYGVASDTNIRPDPLMTLFGPASEVNVMDNGEAIDDPSNNIDKLRRAKARLEARGVRFN